MKKKLLALAVALIMAIQILPAGAITFADGVTVTGIRVSDVSVCEGTNGYYVRDWDSDNAVYYGDYYFYYNDYYPSEITVSYSDGNTFEGTYDELLCVSELPVFLYPSNETYQTYEDPWTVGNHTMVLEIGEASATYNFEIAETPVSKIEAVGRTAIESERGYPLDPQSVTVTYKDGGEVTYENIWELEFNTGYPLFIYDVDGWEEWEIGEHKISCAYMGAESQYFLNIIENPVESIEIAPIAIMEGTHLETHYWWDEETMEPTEYVAYRLWVENYTVNFKNGESVDVYDYMPIEINGDYYDIRVSDDQSPDNVWGIGKHTAHAKLGDLAECDFEVEITESGVESVTVSDVEIIQGMDCDMYDHYDETGAYVGQYPVYYTNPSNITVEMKDGTVYTGGTWEVSMQSGLEIYSYSDQSYENQWGVGEHTAYIKVGGKDFPYKVIIKPSPVKSLVADDVVLYEHNDCYTVETFDPETWEPVKYDEYLINYCTFTVTFNDGRVVKSNSRDGVLVDGEYVYPQLESDQSYENQWGVGEHKAKLSFLGVTTDVKVSLLPSPIKSMSIKDLRRIENVHGFYMSETEWDEETQSFIEYNKYFNYDWDMEFEATCELYDGTVIKAESNCPIWLKEQGVGGFPLSFKVGDTLFYIRFDDDQSYENQWGIGRHVIKAYAGTVSCDFVIDVVPSPVKRLIIDKQTLKYGIDGYSSDEKFIYSLPDMPFSIEFEDGTVLTSSRNGKYSQHSITYDGVPYYIYWDGNYFAENDLEIGKTYQIPVTVGGKDFTVEAEIEGNPYMALTIEDKGDLYLNFTKKDGSVETHKAISFEEYGIGEGGEINGILTTDKGVFQNVTFCYDEPDDELEYHYDRYRMQFTDNLYIDINGMKSNVLEKTEWLAIQETYESMAYTIAGFRKIIEAKEGRKFTGFDGKVTDENLDDIVTIAVNSCEMFGRGYVIDGYGYGVVDVESVKKDVELVFGIKDIDLTGFYGYDESNPDTVKVLEIAVGSGPSETKLAYKYGKWIAKYTEYKDESRTEVIDDVRFNLNGDGRIEKIEFADNDIGEVEEKVEEVTYLEGDVKIDIPESVGEALESCTIDVGKAEEIPQAEENKHKESFGDTAKVLDSYDVKFFDDSGEQIFDLDKEIIIKFKLPENFDPTKALKVAQVDENGNLVLMESWIEDGYVCYKTNWLEK